MGQRSTPLLTMHKYAMHIDAQGECAHLGAASRAILTDLKLSYVGRLAAMPAEELPVVEFAFPGPLRDQLVAAIVAGEKTTTTGLVAEYERENEPLPRPGLRQAVVDSAGHRVAVIETTAVKVMRLGDVDLEHALGEGEGYTSVSEWRAAHERFWYSAEVRHALGDPGFTVDDDTLVVTWAFRLVQDEGQARQPRRSLVPRRVS
jgi:uncharacterized protein YhfF